MAHSNIYSVIELGNTKNARTAKKETKQAVSAELKNGVNWIEQAFNVLKKSDDKKVRDTANRVKGAFGTMIDVVSNCYPYQTADGKLLRKGSTEDGAKIWKEQSISSVSSAVKVVRQSINNYINCIGIDKDLVKVAELGAVVE